MSAIVEKLCGVQNTNICPTVHKKLCVKVIRERSMMRIWKHSSPVRACMQFQIKKATSPLVEELFDM